MPPIKYKGMSVSSPNETPDLNSVVYHDANGRGVTLKEVIDNHSKVMWKSDFLNRLPYFTLVAIGLVVIITKLLGWW
jgi:hypothetical protein